MAKQAAVTSAQLLRRHSVWRLSIKILGVFLFLIAGWSLRHWAVEGVRIPDNALHPAYKSGAWVWVCKLPICLDKAQAGDLLLLETPTGERIIRQIAAIPGEDLTGEQNGRIEGKTFKRILREDSWFIEKATLHAPRKGDTLRFATLAPAQFDLSLRLLREQNPNIKYRVVPSLWLDSGKAPLEKAQAAEIHGIPIRLKELGSMSWQELQLVQMQILRSELGTTQATIRREVWQDTTRLDAFTVQQDCFFALCLRGRDCVDSRELGYIPRNRALGVQFSAGFLAIFRTWIFPTGETK